MKKDRILRAEDSPWMLMEIDWTSLTQGLRPALFKKGHVFYEQDETSDYVFIVNEGRVALRIFTAEGDARTIITLDKGCIFGNLSLFDDQANSCLAISVSDEVSVFTLSKKTVLKRIEEDPYLMHNMLLESNRVNRILTKQMELMTFRNAENIVSFYLMHMANQYSETVHIGENEHKIITMKFTHQDISDVTGLSRVCVSNVISHLMKKEVIKGKEKGRVLSDMKKLKDRLKI